jgi:hypothetical protein
MEKMKRENMKISYMSKMSSNKGRSPAFLKADIDEIDEGRVSQVSKNTVGEADDGTKVYVSRAPRRRQSFAEGSLT